MEYKYGENKNYEDFSSGRVFYHKSGVTNFPIRLAQEIYGRCLSYSEKKEDITLYDCCCGGGYLLTSLGFLNQDTLGEIIGSDIDEASTQVAQKNLDLLTDEGLDQRLEEIRHCIKQYQKVSHLDAEKSALKLKEMIINKALKRTIFVSDALGRIEMVQRPDIIIVDVPYGELVAWQSTEQQAIDSLLTSLYEICTPHTIIGICMDKKQKVTNNPFSRLEKQSIGKRKFEILRKKVR